MKKVLMFGQAGCRSGFARVLKGVADRLDARGWEVVVRGTSFQEDHGIDYSYDVQTATYGGPDRTGADTLQYHIEDIKPDVLWALEDPWNLAGYASEKPKDLPSVCYVPVDTPCLKWEWGLDAGCWSQAATYTKFGATEYSAAVQDALDIVFESQRGKIPFDKPVGWSKVPDGRKDRWLRFDRLAQLQNPSGWNVVPHGADLTTFFPEDKEAARREFGFDEDAFIVGFVGGNWSRKRLDLAIRSFSIFAAKAPRARLAIHCYNGDEDGYDIAHLARLYGISDRVYVVHWAWPVLTDVQMRVLYNTFDVLLNTSGGEGWGLPAFEAAACGVVQMAPNWAAMRELWSEHGMMCHVKEWRHEALFLNTAHCSVDPQHVAERLHELYRYPEFWKLMSDKALARAKAAYSWDVVGDGFATILDKAIANPEPIPITLDEVIAARQDRIVSEILAAA